MSAFLFPFQHFSNILYYYKNNEMSSLTSHVGNYYAEADRFTVMHLLQKNTACLNLSINFLCHGLFHSRLFIDFEDEGGDALLATPPQSSEDWVADCDAL